MKLGRRLFRLNNGKKSHRVLFSSETLSGSDVMFIETVNTEYQTVFTDTDCPYEYTSETFRKSLHTIVSGNPYISFRYGGRCPL